MKNSLIIFGLLIFFLIISTFVLIPMGLPLYNELINPFLWIAMCGVSVYLCKDTGLRFKGEKEKIQSLLIAMIIYIIVYFLLGLVFGFEKTPYSKTLFNILRNLWSFAGVIFFQEIIRQCLVKECKKKIWALVLIAFVFGLLNLNLSNFDKHFVDLKTAFIYCSTTLVPTFLESAIMTYLVYVASSKASIIYRLFVTVPPFIVPIIPALDWFGTAIVGVSLPLGVYIYLNYVHLNKTERLSKREKRKYNPVIYIPLFVFVGVLAGFVIGLFKYQPIAVLSGSMAPTFDRGDAVVVMKLNTQEKERLQKGDVIQFVSGARYVVHRIVEITNDEYGNKQFITKGDHNNTKDAGKVNLQDVKGKVSFVVPLIGFPSVWLSGAIS